MTIREVQVSLPITDRRRALAFYIDVLRLEPVGPLADDGVPEPLQLRLDERTLLVLIPSAGLGWVLGERPLAPLGVSECLLGLTVGSVDEVDRMVDRARSAGGEILSGPVREEWGYTALFADVDGHAWQVVADAS